MIQLRLRHLRAIYGRNFEVSSNELQNALGISFAISSPECKECGCKF